MLGRHTPDRRGATAPRRPGVSASGLLLLAATLGLLALGVGPRTGLYRTVTMLTASMRPIYPVGTVLIDAPEPTSQLRVGQVLTYQIPVDDHRVVSHRVVSIQRQPGGATLVGTKGDANNGPDPWHARITDANVWTVQGKIPYLGLVLLWLRQPLTLAVFRYLLPGTLLVWVLKGIWVKPSGSGRGRHASA